MTRVSLQQLFSGFIAAFCLALSCKGAPDFEKEVAPILEAKCLSCHNEHDAKGDFVLANRGQALGFENGVVPGNSEASLLIKMVSGDEPEMPKKSDPLSPSEIETLRAWIAKGAVWPKDRILADNPKRDLDWWSLRPIQQGAFDERTLLDRKISPVDFFISKKLAENKLTPVSRAPAEVLIRRVTYDLTGLPPTPEEIDAFLKTPDWDSLVDRLLASSDFGEKFAQHWLDIGRYAETHGYDKDKPRNNAWPYRDYVIRSFNSDKPYSKFVQEQVAGDVLFPGEPDGVVALGFLAAGPWDFIGHQEVGEGKLDGRIAKHLDRDEIVSAVFNVFQSATVQCAQCHHHKFDPIRMEDYYRLHAVFSAVDRADRVYTGLPPDQEKLKLTLQKQIGELQAERRKIDTDAKRVVAAKTSGLDRRIAELKEKYGSGLKPQYGYHSTITSRQDDEKWVQLDLGKSRGATEIRMIPAFDNYGGIGAGFGFPMRFRVEVANDAAFKNGIRILLDATGVDFQNPKTTTIKVEGDESRFRFLRITATKLRERKNDYIFALGEVEVLNEGGAENFALGATVSAKDSIEAAPRWGRANLVDEIFYRELSNDAALGELRDLQEKRDAIEQKVRPADTDSRLAAIDANLKPLNEKFKKIPSGEMVYAATAHFTSAGNFRSTNGKPRVIRLLHRGDMTTPGDVMAPGVPALWKGATDLFFEGSDWNEGDAREKLASYLTQHDNPLVWRSIANRIWGWTFGKALVETQNDFGRGGMQPTHPELLDFLAAKLRDDPGQSMKSVVRLLVMSEVYRRASGHDEKNAEIDAGNAFFWRANRRRLTAEEFRDSVLVVSGKLDRTMGGPSFSDFIIEKPQHSPHYEYHLHDPNDPKSHRRSVYRFVVRSQPNPMLTTLDCADPSMSVPARDESTTALQALTTWNHRFVEAMSGHFANRLRKAELETSEAKVNWAFRLATGQSPTDTEKQVLIELLDEYGEESFSRVILNLNSFVYVD